MPKTPSRHLDSYSDEFLRVLMRRQLRLSIACVVAFLSVLFVLPILNYLAPEFMSRRVLGFTLTWMILGVGFFPAVWVIAWVFIRRSISLEEQEWREVSFADAEAARQQIGTEL